MGTETHCLYGDGTHEVNVTGDEVMLSDGEGGIVVLSRDAFREVVIGWTRLLEQEQEKE